MQTDSKTETAPPGSLHPAGYAPRRFYWKQCYELDGMHWALCDSQTDGEAPPERVTTVDMVMLDHWNDDFPTRPFPKLVVELLNAHFAHNDPSSATRPAGRHDCNSSAMAGFAAAYG